MKKILLAFLSLAFLQASLFAERGGWVTDFEAAKKLAAESNKDLLVSFTGSDWCGWSAKLHDEVFNKKAFKAKAGDDFVLVNVDFPSGESRIDETTLEQNQELQKKYAVQVFPTVLLCEANGKPYARAGYQSGGAKKYIAHLENLHKLKHHRDEAFATAANLEGPEKAKLLVSVLESMGLEDAVVANFYGEIPLQITSADPWDETGFAKRAANKKRMENYFDHLNEFIEEKDYDGALAFAGKTLQKEKIGREMPFLVSMTRVQILEIQKNFTEAIPALDQAGKFAPEGSEEADIVSRMREGFVQEVENEGK